MQKLEASHLLSKNQRSKYGPIQVVITKLCNIFVEISQTNTNIINRQC